MPQCFLVVQINNLSVNLLSNHVLYVLQICQHIFLFLTFLTYIFFLQKKLSRIQNAKIIQAKLLSLEKIHKLLLCKKIIKNII